MDNTSKFLIQILERLGSPLLSAVLAVSRETNAGEQGDTAGDAARMAELLGKAVQSGIAIASAMELKGDDDKADSVRLSLTALAATLIADQYRTSRRIPGDRELERITGALSAVLSFADNFSPAAENASRLKILDVEAAAYDEHQAQAMFFYALSPAINAIAEYAFGRKDTKLLQDVSRNLTVRARELREKLFPEVTGEPQSRQVELGLLKALVSIYVECHRAETGRLLAMKEDERARAAQENGGELSMEPVWQAFANRAAMLEIAGAAILPDGAAEAKSAGDAVAPAAPPAKTPEEKPAREEPAKDSAKTAGTKSPPQKPAIFSKKQEGKTAPPPEGETSPPPAQKPEEPPAQPDENYNPMAFFKPGKKDEKGDSQS